MATLDERQIATLQMELREIGSLITSIGSVTDLPSKMARGNVYQRERIKLLRKRGELKNLEIVEAALKSINEKLTIISEILFNRRYP